MMWLVWFTIGVTGVGWLAGAFCQELIHEREKLRKAEETAEKQAYIRRLIEERKELLAQGRIGRAL